jgi:anti-anti-sigma factor
MSFAPQPLQFNHRITPERITVIVRGEIDMATAAEFRAAMTDRLSDGSVTSVHLDLSGVSFMDSSGVHAMLSVQRAAQSVGGDLRVTRSSPQVDRLLSVMGLDCVFAEAVSEFTTARVLGSRTVHQVAGPVTGGLQRTVCGLTRRLLAVSTDPASCRHCLRLTGAPRNPPADDASPNATGGSRAAPVTQA